MLFAILLLIICILLIGIYLNVLYGAVRKAKVLTVIPSATGNYKNGEKIMKEYSQAPGPFPWPLLGNLALLGQHDVPFEAFTSLTQQYGDIYTLTLGSTRCLVVNNLELIREVLNQNGKFFGGRPDFMRYHVLFGGDRNNSLALCDWSTLQQRRRNLARRHCSPRDSSSYFAKMSVVGCAEMEEFMAKLGEVIVPGEKYELKPLIQRTCANMFIQYMCSLRFQYEDEGFKRIVEHFDEIFWEINQGYAVDFLPFLSPFYKRHMGKIAFWSSSIRRFILERIVNDRERNIDMDEPETDFTDALLKSLVEDNVPRDTIIFMLEDFVGGHSAVGNLVMLAISYIVRDQSIARRIQEEVDRVTDNGQRRVTLMDMDDMPFTVATIFEVLRYSSSPIVPHVATEDAVVSGHGVTKGTIIFINNYVLNTSEKYWSEPERFNPERFIETVSVGSKRRTSESSDSGISSKRRISESSDSGLESEKVERKVETVTRVKKNIPHFLPFSIGKRTCIGQNLVRGFGFIMLANIMQSYNVSCPNLDDIKTYPACVALPAKTFSVTMTPRERT